jgi:hypothetical protein
VKHEENMQEINNKDKILALIWRLIALDRDGRILLNTILPN